MTRDQFYNIAENWYQRTHRLREIWQNPDESQRRQKKALVLWSVMRGRVVAMMQMAIVAHQPKPHYSHGASVAGISQPEIILNKGGKPVFVLAKK